MNGVLNKIVTFPLGVPILSISQSDLVVKHFSMVTRSLFLKNNEEIFLQIVDLGLLGKILEMVVLLYINTYQTPQI